MAGHGLQKLAGWFGGGGLEQTAAGFDRLGLRPGRQHAVAAGVTEVLSGTGAVLGAVTPLASAMTTGTMTVAVGKVHGRNGPWITKGGYEYNATLLAVAFALAAAGPGRAAARRHAAAPPGRPRMGGRPARPRAGVRRGRDVERRAGCCRRVMATLELASHHCRQSAAVAARGTGRAVAASRRIAYTLR